MPKKPDLSFIIPIRDEKPSLKQLTKEIETVCKKIKKTYEIIFVDDGSLDGSFKVIKDLRLKNKNIKGIKLRRNFGKSTALSAGFQASFANVVITMDGDLQDNPIEIPRFLKKLDKGFDLVSGWKKNRIDPLTKTIPSIIFNFATSKLTRVNIHDFNCGFKAYRREVVNSLQLHGELYRFIPTIAHQKGYRVAEITVKHRKRKYGKSKYGLSRLLSGFLDLITILFLTGYASRPGHFFGTIGIIFFIPGFLIGSYITYLRISTGGISYRYPLLFLGVLLMIVGIQFISTGLLAEMILGSRKQSNSEEITSEKIKELAL
jgi:glycosyltransferase involved in cell wall biosynthesis